LRKPVAALWADKACENLNLKLKNCHEINKGKGKAVPLHAMEAHGGRGGIAPAHT
jgi:hypothetical protein